MAATAVVAVVAVLSSCSRGSSTRVSPTVASTTVETTTTSPPLTSTTTTVASTSTAPARPTTTSPTSSPEGHAKALYEAWTRGDRAAAAAVAQPQVVDDLFARQWRQSDGWTFAECSGAAGSVICSWRRPAGQQLLFRVQNVTGGGTVTVSDVRFQP